jgi:glycosyltransferase involved in cell wall biosynthesis
VRPVHQLLVGATRHDAITAMALATRDRLRQDRPSEVFAYYLGTDAAEMGVRPVIQLREEDRTSALLYHSSFGIPEITDIVLSWSGPLLLAYHNITPSRFYRRFDPAFADGLDWGRAELPLIRDKVVHAFADSNFNSQELLLLGYQSVSVEPLGLHPHRLRSVPTDPVLVAEVNQRFPDGFVLVVSQVLPHKQMEIAIQAVHVLRAQFDSKLGLVIAGPHRNHAYLSELRRLADSLPAPAVDFPGGVTDSELATYYRTAVCLLSTSAHEGYSLPPLEAMSEGTCVVVRAAGAIPETVGSGGLLVPEDSTASEFAGCIRTVLDDARLTRELRAAGRKRATELASSYSMTGAHSNLERWI